MVYGAAAQLIATNICGSDLHMYHGRTSFPAGMAFGHEITGEVVEAGPGVHNINVGDWISVPFNISCGTCKNCKQRMTQACLKVNPAMPGGAYGSDTAAYSTQTWPREAARSSVAE